MSALALLRAPFLSALLLVLAVLSLGAAVMPMDRYRAYAERHEQAFDEDRQRARCVASAVLGGALLLGAIGVTLL